MKIHRNGKVIHDSELTKDKSPDLIHGDMVTLSDFECFFTRQSAVYDVVETGNACKKGTLLSSVVAGQAFEPQDRRKGNVL